MVAFLWLLWQILAENPVSLLSCCSAVLCQALQQYTGCIFNCIILHLLTTVLCYWKDQPYAVSTNCSAMYQTIVYYILMSVLLLYCCVSCILVCTLPALSLCIVYICITWYWVQSPWLHLCCVVYVFSLTLISVSVSQSLTQHITLNSVSCHVRIMNPL